MLDIQGQSSPVVSQVAAPLPRPTQAPVANIPSVSSGPPVFTYLGAVLVVLFMVAAGGFLSFTKTQTMSLIATRTRSVDQLTAELGTPELTKTATLADQLRLGTTALQAAVAKQPVWTPLLTELVNRMPAGSTLVSVSIDDSQHLRLNGSATTYQHLATLLATLAASDQFQGVELESSTLNESTQGISIAFSVKATIVPPSAVTTLAPIETIEESNGNQ